LVLEIKITSSIPLFALGSKIICLTSISILLFATNVMVGSAQQGEIQVESEEDLEATLNGDSFRTGDTITVSGTIEDPNTQSFVNMEVIDPESAIVVQAFPEITAKGAQGTISGYDFTTIAAASYIPISTEESLTEEDETEESPLRVAFVKPSFTYAVYQLNGFYNFYNKYSYVTDETTNVTTDLDLLTVEVPDETYIYIL
jgi:hypothetical protein